MDERRLPKQVLYGQLLDAPRKAGGQKLRFKDTLRHNLQNVGIDKLGNDSMCPFNVEEKYEIRLRSLQGR